MPYDEDLANRTRELLAQEDGVTEQRMFGGLAFLVGGHLAVAASRDGGLITRVDPADSDALLARPHVTRMEMGGRSMGGWLEVAPAGVARARDLAGWVRRSLDYVHALPPKKPRG